MQYLLALRALPWKLIGYAALGLALASALVALKIERTTSAKLKAQIERCTEARKADQSAYRAAQEQSRANNLAHVRKVESEQRAKTDEVESRWNADRARLAELMRHKGTPANKGAAGSAGSPAVPDTPGRVDEEAAVCVPASGALSAAETELKLRHLQDWITEQLTLNPS